MLRSTMIIAAAMTSLLLVTAQESAAEESRWVDGDELASLLIGNTIKGKDSAGAYFLYYPDGDEKGGAIRARMRGNVKDNGTWRAKGDKYCRKYKKLDSGRERCYEFKKRGDQIMWYYRGSQTDVSTLLSGNPEKL